MELVEGDLIEVGDTIRVGEHGQIDLSFDNAWKNTIRIAKGSEVRFNADIPVSLELLGEGSILAKYAECRASRSLIRGPLGSGKTIQTINKIFDFFE